MCAVTGSTLQLITHLFLTILIAPFNRYNWYGCAKNGEIAVGYAIQLFNHPYGQYWIDLAQFDKDCYRAHYEKHVQRPANPTTNGNGNRPSSTTNPSDLEIMEKKTAAWKLAHELSALMKNPTEENIQNAHKRLSELSPISTDQAIPSFKKMIEILNSICTAPDLAAKRSGLEDLNKFDGQFLIPSDFIKLHATEIARWYLEDLDVSQEKQIEQLRKIWHLLQKDDPKKHESLLIRIANRIQYIQSKNQVLKEKIREEPNDQIKKHFCALHSISYVEETN